MRKISLALAFIAGLFALPAQAANFSAKDAGAATIIFTNPGNCTTGCTPIFAWSDSTGANLVAVLTAGADAASNTATGGLTYSRNLVFNGTTWDRWTGLVTAAQSGTWNITNISGTISLPTGASTSALQTTGNTSLSSLDTKTPSLVSNAGSAVATGASNVPGIAYLYGFNGTTYDQLQVDASKFLKVNCATGCSASTSITSWGGGTLGAMANYGTSPGSVLVPGVNAFVTNATPGIANNADGIASVTASATSPVPVNNYNYVYNGTTWDRLRSGTQTGSVAVASADPCLGANKTNLPISQNGTSSVQLIALSGSTVIYVCSLSLIFGGATTMVLTTGTGSACVTGNAAVLGDTTANIANGLSFAANGGLTLGNGAGTILKGAASSELCMTLGTSVRASGNLTYVQQ